MVRCSKQVRSLAAGLAGFLLTLAAFAQDGSAVAGAGGQAARIDVNGVMISRHNRSALINGRVWRIGDRIGDVEIVAIDQREIRLRAGSRETNVLVGTSMSLDDHFWSPIAPEPVESQVQTVMAVTPEPVFPETTPDQTSRRHEVLPGETLSEIAEAYLVPGVRRHQLMIAIFEANPHAFRGNINLMRADVVLDITAAESLTRLPPEKAMAKVMEHTDRWRSERPRQSATVRPPKTETYGPVSSGESLSLIAHRLAPKGGDAPALMSALYRANPHAFGGSMNMLREGAVLEIPDRFDIDGRPPEPGTVVAHVSPIWKPARHDD